MASFDQVQKVMAQVGERLACQAVTEYEQHKSWIIVVDDATVVEIAFDERINLLHATSPTGDLPQQRRQTLCELLLRYNNQWSATGGLRMSLDAEKDGLSLTASLPADNLDPSVLARQLGNFARAARDWRELIGAWPSDGDKSLAATELFETLIRV